MKIGARFRSGSEPEQLRFRVRLARDGAPLERQRALELAVWLSFVLVLWTAVGTAAAAERVVADALHWLATAWPARPAA